MNLRQLLGARGERRAARYLRRSGYRIVKRNYQCPVGEVDLVALDGDTLVFIEVKTRSGEGEPAEPVRWAQRNHLERAAKYFLAQYHLQHKPCRFDVVTINWPAHGQPRIEHFPDAFPARYG